MIGLQIQDNVSAALKKYGDVFGGSALAAIMLKAGQYAGVAAESVVSSYPTPTGKPLALFYTRTRKGGSTYLSKFKTMKQQRFVMGLGKQGKIPYKRTGTLGKSITGEAQNASANGVDIVIGTNRAYAKYVIGSPPQQSHYHMGNWTPLATDMQNNITTIANAFSKAALQEINARLK